LTSPGRFLAANMIKIVLTHLLVSYDFKLEEGAHPNIRRVGDIYTANPRSQIILRKRLVA